MTCYDPIPTPKWLKIALIGALMTAVTYMFAVGDIWAATCTQVSRTNVSANSILTSTEYNTSLNNLYTAHNSFDLGCSAASSFDDPALFLSSAFGALLNGIKEGCSVTNTDTNTISVDRCMLSVNGNMVRTTTATTVTWGCGSCSSESASTVYFVKAKNDSTGTTLNLLIDTTAPNADGYDASNNRVLAMFVNNASSNIESVANAIRGNVFEKKLYVDAFITGANPSLSSTSVASYTGIEDAGLTLTNQTNSIQTFIPCSSTNDSTGTTCAAGNESLGVSFYNPVSQSIEVCASFGLQYTTDADSTIQSAFQIVQTPNAAQTLTTEGGSRFGPGVLTINTSAHFGQHVCGVFPSVSAGKVTFRLMYEILVSNTSGTNAVFADADATVGQRNVKFTARSWPGGF